ncbi:MAG: putative 2OG-Fe(II) oxygenase [Hyphomonadaceae bacterium]
MAFDIKALTEEAEALQKAGRVAECIALHRRIVSGAPRSGVAAHNLASALANTGRWREAEASAREAFARGLDAPETWLVLAHCLQGQVRWEEAADAYRQAIARRPSYYQAHTELAQMRWMRAGDVDEALRDLDAAIDAYADPKLSITKFKILKDVGREADAYALVLRLAQTMPDDGVVLTAAAQAASAAGRTVDAVTFAERAAALWPDDGIVLGALATAYLGCGQIAHAAAAIEKLRAKQPQDQFALALQATAWRLFGDERYRALYDYDALVYAQWLDTPAGWTDREAYVADLRAALASVHVYKTHPFNQSIRHGSQVPNVLQQEHRAIQALPQALDGPIKRYIAKLGRGADPLRARNAGDYAFQGMWSIRMGAGGMHVNHVHPEGWISSACYIDVPRTMDGREGWIKFGEPGISTLPALTPEHFIEPAPGKLVLFPSYMWHGTVPYTDPSPRMTVAFDLTPQALGGASG